MLSGLILTAFLMGLGGVPHCAAMCGAACAAALPRGVPLASLLGRCLGYAALGAVAAASAGLVAQWGRQVTFVQPLWVLLQAAAMMLGMLMLWRGRVPAPLDEFGQGLYRSLKARWAASSVEKRWPALRAMLPFLAGLAWAALPCGLLYAALMVAALAPSALGGATVMLAFALPSALGVWAAPTVLRRLTGGQAAGMRAVSASVVNPARSASGLGIAPVIWMQQLPDGGRHDVPGGSDVPSVPVRAVPGIDPTWAVRLSGVMLAALAAWALYHQVMDQWRAWCA